MATVTWQAADGSAYDMDALNAALRDISNDCPYPVLTTVDASNKRPVSRAVSACAFCPTGAGFERVRVRVRADTRKLAHIANRDWGTVCLAYTSAPHRACFTLTGRATCSDGRVPMHKEQRRLDKGVTADGIDSPAQGVVFFGPSSFMSPPLVSFVAWTSDGFSHSARSWSRCPDARFVFMEIDVDAIELVSHGHKLARDAIGRQPIVLQRTITP